VGGGLYWPVFGPVLAKNPEAVPSQGPKTLAHRDHAPSINVYLAVTVLVTEADSSRPAFQSRAITRIPGHQWVATIGI